MQIARKVFGKRATYKHYDTDRWVTLSNKDICRRWQLLPHGIEMTLRRIKFYQNWILHPEPNSQLLMAMFGSFEFDDALPFIDATGKIDTTHAHPWLLQLCDDFVFIFLHVDDLALDAEIIANRYLLLFVSHPVGSELYLTCQHFAHFDLHTHRPLFVTLSQEEHDRHPDGRRKTLLLPNCHGQ